jgi:enoyl-CoA hydratase
VLEYHNVEFMRDPDNARTGPGRPVRRPGRPPGPRNGGADERQRRDHRPAPADLALRLHELPAAVIAAVNGPAAGGGFALALAADIRVASEAAVFIAANVKIGVSGGEMGMTWRLPRLIGEGRAAEMLLTGRRMGATEALAAGLVTAVVPADQLQDTACGVAGQVIATSHFTTWMTKELLDANASAGSLRHAVQNENRTQVLCNFTGDIAEAVAAFREGGPPVFGS